MQSNKIRKIGAVVILALAVVMVIASYQQQSVSIRSDVTMQTILGVLGGLFILVLLIERTTEILVSIGRMERTESLKQEQEMLSRDAQKTIELEKKSQELIIYQAETKQFALLVGFSISVLMCSGGVGVLSAIVAMPEPAPPFMRGIDIVLTSGLLAGGSDSFHQFVRAIESFFGSPQKTGGSR